MANSKYAYVRGFELPDSLIPATYLVVRLDGHSFHRFSDDHGFEKPNDERALRLMDAAARHVMKTYPEVAMAFGESDEFSFLLRKTCNLYNRRSSKISSTFASLFAAAYTFQWSTFFPDTPLQYPPSFDGRVVAYPSSTEVMDYFSWRQADTHINYMYNTTFWALVLKGGLSTAEAHAALKGTSSSQKQEILFSKYKINYNTLPERFRKGSVLYRQEVKEETSTTEVASAQIKSEESNTMETSRVGKSARTRWEIVVGHCDVIGPGFWDRNKGILGLLRPRGGMGVSTYYDASLPVHGGF